MAPATSTKAPARASRSRTPKGAAKAALDAAKAPSPTKDAPLAPPDDEGTGREVRTTPADAMSIDLMHVEVAKIDLVDGFNPRREYDQDALNELAASIARHGVLTPLILAPAASGRFKVLGGHRRYKAAVIAKVATVPAVIRHDATDDVEVAMLDNAKRVDLTPLEEAFAFKRLIDEKGYTPRGVSEVLDVPLRRVTERLRIVDLGPTAQVLLNDGQLSTRHVAFLADVAAVDQKFADHLAKYGVNNDSRGGHVRDDPPGWLTYGANDYKGAVSLRGTIRLTERQYRNDGHPHPAIVRASKKQAIAEQLTALAEYAKRFKGDYSGKSPSWATYGGELHLQWERSDVNAARAAGVLIIATAGNDTTAHVVTDGKWLASQFEVLVGRLTQSMEDRKKKDAAAAKRKQTAAGKAADGKVDELTPREREEAEAKARQKQERADAKAAINQARELNLQLGRALMEAAASVDVGKMPLDVARFLCLSLFRAPGTYGERHNTDVSTLAGKLRLVLEGDQWAKWLDPKQNNKPAWFYTTDQAALAKAFWAWLGEAKTARDLVAKTLIVYGAVEYSLDAATPKKDKVWATIIDGGEERYDNVKALRAFLEPDLPPWVKQLAKARHGGKSEAEGLRILRTAEASDAPIAEPEQPAPEAAAEAQEAKAQVKPGSDKITAQQVTRFVAAEFVEKGAVKALVSHKAIIEADMAVASDHRRMRDMAIALAVDVLGWSITGIQQTDGYGKWADMHGSQAAAAAKRGREDPLYKAAADELWQGI